MLRVQLEVLGVARRRTRCRRPLGGTVPALLAARTSRTPGAAPSACVDDAPVPHQKSERNRHRCGTMDYRVACRSVPVLALGRHAGRLRPRRRRAARRDDRRPPLPRRPQRRAAPDDAAGLPGPRGPRRQRHARDARAAARAPARAARPLRPRRRLRGHRRASSTRSSSRSAKASTAGSTRPAQSGDQRREELARRPRRSSAARSSSSSRPTSRAGCSELQQYDWMDDAARAAVRGADGRAAKQLLDSRSTSCPRACRRCRPSSCSG